MFKVYAQEITTFAKLVMSTTEKKEKREGECGKRERERDEEGAEERERDCVLPYAYLLRNRLFG